MHVICLRGADWPGYPLAGNDAPATGAAFVETSLQCHAESSGTRDFKAPGGANIPLQGPCFYRLYATYCNVPSTSGDRTRQSCRTESLMEFALHRGETKTVTMLPAGYRYCVSLQAPLALEACMRNPQPQCGGAPVRPSNRVVENRKQML